MGERQPLIPLNQNQPVEPPDFRSAKMEKANRETKQNRDDEVEEPSSKRHRSDRPNSDGDGGGNVGDDEETLQQANSKRHRSDRPHPGGEDGGGDGETFQHTMTDLRVLRSHYIAIKNIINDEKEEICRGDSKRFQKIIGEMDRLHEHVSQPREQVTDAETLLEMANTLVTSLKAHSKEGFTPSDFVNCLLREFGTPGSIKWNAIGLLVCPVFKNGYGCSTMIGPMNAELKQRKVTAPRRRTKLTGSTARPEQLKDNGADEKTDTDKNMATMFNILGKKKTVKLENLILNRSSFAQTVENMFALSFLAKDGRVQIKVDEQGSHLVSPKNAPNADVVSTGNVVYNHFVFRFDFKDWKLMTDAVSGGEELMPHRHQVSIPLSQSDVLSSESSLAAAAIPTE